MRYRHNPSSSAFDVANHLLFILLIVSFIFPFVYIFSVSISGYAEITLNAVKLLPKGELHLNSYRILLMATNIETAYANSVLYAVLTVILTVVFTSAAAFALERQSLPFRKVILVFIVLTMFVPTNMIPSFLVMIGIGLYNTRWAIVLPSCFSAWYIFIMRANIRSTIGSDLREAAYLDGAGDLYVYLRIVLPLIKPILATIGLFAAVESWNNYAGPLIYLTDATKFPLPLILQRILLEGRVGKYTGSFQSNLQSGPLRDVSLEGWVGPGFFKSFKFAAIILTIWPIIVVYPFIQKYFVRGILVGSVKD
jgi:putative aldouronate transport system permease protein